MAAVELDERAARARIYSQKHSSSAACVHRRGDAEARAAMAESAARVPPWKYPRAGR